MEFHGSDGMESDGIGWNPVESDGLRQWIDAIRWRGIPANQLGCD